MTPIWKYRQRRAFENVWREAERKRRRERFIAGPLGWIVEAPSVLTSWPFIFVLIVLWSLALIGVSFSQVPIPKPCIELAESLGRSIPPVVGKLKYEHTKAELRFLSNDDPAVKKCREALAKMEAKR